MPTVVSATVSVTGAPAVRVVTIAGVSAVPPVVIIVTSAMAIVMAAVMAPVVDIVMDDAMRSMPPVVVAIARNVAAGHEDNRQRGDSERHDGNGSGQHGLE